MPDFDFRHAPKPARVRQDSDLIKPESIFRGSSPGVTTWHRALSTSPKVNIGGAGLSRFDDAGAAQGRIFAAHVADPRIHIARTSTNHTIKTAKPPLPAPLGASTTESAESLRLRLLKLDDWLETSTSKSQPASGGPGQPSLERWPPSPERASASLPTPAAMSARAHLVREGLAPSRHAGSSSISVTYQARRRRSSRAGTSDVLDRGEDELLENATLGDADGQPFQGDVEPSHATRRTMTPRAVASSDVAEAPSSPANTALSGWDTRSRSQSVWQTDATEQDPGKPSSDMPATPSQTTPTREIAHSDASPTFPASHSNRLFFSPPIKGFYARLTTAVLTLPSPRLDYAVAVDWTGPCSATANQRRELKDVYRFSRAQSGPLVIEGQPSDHLGLGSTGAGLSSSAPIATVEARLTAWRAANGCELDFDDWKWLEEDVLGLADWDEDEWEQLEWLLGLANDVHDDPRRNEGAFGLRLVLICVLIRVLFCFQNRSRRQVESFRHPNLHLQQLRLSPSRSSRLFIRRHLLLQPTASTVMSTWTSKTRTLTKWRWNWTIS